MKPRNTYVPLMRQRKSGVHEQSKKAKRQQERMALKKVVTNLKEGFEKLPSFSKPFFYFSAYFSV